MLMMEIPLNKVQSVLNKTKPAIDTDIDDLPKER